MRFRGRLCVPTTEVQEDLLHEAHRSMFSIHPGSIKMYKDLKRHYWWPGMKKSVAELVARCLVCQQVKADHAKTPGLLQPLSIPEWKWEHITMDFVTGLPRTPSGYDAIWVIVDRLTKSAHFIPYRVGQSTAVLARKLWPRLSDCMECLSVLFLTVILDLYLVSGRVYRSVWVPLFITAQPIILSQMGR